MLQNATSLRKSAPWPPNISDEHVSCTAPATRNASWQRICTCPTPAIVFGNATKPSRFARLWEGVVRACCAFNILNPKCASRHNGVHFLDSSTSKKCFWRWCALYVFTSTCASRHCGVHFFNISSSKNALALVCFVRFYFGMCFAPQRRALFQHLIFQKCSGAGVFYTFLLRSVLRARAACNDSSLIWPEGSAPKSLEKHCVSRLFYLFAHRYLLSSDSFSSLMKFILLFSSLTLPTYAFPSVHIVGNLTSKLPSRNAYSWIILYRCALQHNFWTSQIVQDRWTINYMHHEIRPILSQQKLRWHNTRVE